MSKYPLRRSQLIAPFGVGAMQVVRDGTSLITCGLDHWYRQDDENVSVDLDEYKIDEWRLQKRLKVDHFRMPPDFRKKWRDEKIPNTGHTIPLLRFPKWHYCTNCGHMFEYTLPAREKLQCSECKKKGITRYMVQVPFVAICDHGHIQDFPWREWVHGSVNPSCQRPMRLISTGGATLASQIIECECEKKRPLENITIVQNDGSTILTTKLDKTGMLYTCSGKRPWLGDEIGSGCGRHLRGSLRSASNVYYPSVYSSIYLPRGNETTPSELIAFLEEPQPSTFIKLMESSGVVVKHGDLRKMYGLQLSPFSDKQVEIAIQIVLKKDISQNQDNDDLIVDGDDPETSFRRQEFNVLRVSRDEEHLRTREVDINSFEADISMFFSRIILVDKLRETRVLGGFHRIFPENEQSPEEIRSLLWRDVPSGDNMWLPAYIVYGEGIYLELHEEKFQQWLEFNNDVLKERLQPLIDRYRLIQQDRRLRERPIGPKFILLHTLAHLLMNRLTFECGYSSASLRERLYISDNPQAPMSGILIYTAAGDSEGTLGGLVRMGNPGYLEPVVRRALESAKWCSADPVCMEMGSRGGQGPNSCNLAACHNCALVPETACEEFNMFLDRALVVGDISNSGLGYFTT